MINQIKRIWSTENTNTLVINCEYFTCSA